MMRRAQPSRRQFAASLAAIAATGCAHRVAPLPVAAQAPGPDLTTLRAAAASRGLLAGAAVDVGRLRTDIRYAALLAAQAGIVVAVNEMKFEATEPEPGNFRFDDADFLATFAAQQGMKLRGHNFVWHRGLPSWFVNTVTTANAEQVLVRHIEAVAGHFRGRVHSWDVVNEAIEPNDTLPGGLRNSPWQKLLPGYIDIAFRAARKADPAALLCYNDYGVEGEDDDAAAKRQAVLALVRGMQSRGVPIDAVGIQSHLLAGERYGPSLVGFMLQLQSMGLKLLLTEMDVNDRTLPPDAAHRDTAVALAYGEYLRQTLAVPALIAVLTWGITDRYTWLNYEGNRADGLPERCLPFDEHYAPKPAFFAALNVLKDAPARILNVAMEPRGPELRIPC